MMLDEEDGGNGILDEPWFFWAGVGGAFVMGVVVGAFL